MQDICNIYIKIMQMFPGCCQYVYYKVKVSFPGKTTDRAVLGLKMCITMNKALSVEDNRIG